jgi:hypothetical protein
VGIVVVVHTTKAPSPTDPFNEITGTMGLQGAADTLMVMRGPRDSFESEIHVTGRRLMAPVSALTRWEPELGVITWLGDLETARESGHQAAVLEALAGAQGEALSAGRIAEETGLDSSAVRTLLCRLVKPGGFVGPSAGGTRRYPRRRNSPFSPPVREVASCNATAHATGATLLHCCVVAFWDEAGRPSSSQGDTSREVHARQRRGRGLNATPTQQPIDRSSMIPPNATTQQRNRGFK